MTPETNTADRDSAQLEALGYDSKFDRSMSLWANFSLGFTYLSPVVGVYTLFAFAIVAGGPPMFWNYLFVAIGQLFVAMVFGEIVSQFPIAGGLYPWARRLVGKRWAWMAGWVYLWALFTTIAGVAVGGAPFLAQLLGINAGQAGEVAIAVGLIVVTTALNVSGTKLLARVAMFGFICELWRAARAFLSYFKASDSVMDIISMPSLPRAWPPCGATTALRRAEMSRKKLPTPAVPSPKPCG